MHERTGRRLAWLEKEPFPICLLVVTYMSVGVSGRGLVDVQASGVVFVTAVS